jgi:hypothetical protein
VAAQTDPEQASVTLARSDFEAIQGNFLQALSLVIVCQRSLDAQALAETGDEETALREAITLLRSVYNQLDTASWRTSPVTLRATIGGAARSKRRARP